ncbi:hypothetical protein FRC18_008800 [Serendipita sp. 400]|nr:hypothetical protein FRC18_008800 [Serendipita sp. 400]
MSFGSQGPYYGGGGFMKNSPGGFGTQATPGGDGGNQKQGNRSLRPVNIAQVLESKQSNSENEWLIDGQPVTMVPFRPYHAFVSS